MDTPAPEYVATVLAAYALNHDGEILRAHVEGLPTHLLSLLSGAADLSGRRTEYRIATAPKKIEVGEDGTYYDWETGVGAAVY